MCDEHGDYLTRWAHIAESIALNDESLHNSLTQTFRYRAARAAINIAIYTGRAKNTFSPLILFGFRLPLLMLASLTFGFMQGFEK